MIRKNDKHILKSISQEQREEFTVISIKYFFHLITLPNAVFFLINTESKRFSLFLTVYTSFSF